MTADQNLAVVRRNVDEAMNQGILAVVDETYATDAVLHVAGQPDAVGRTAIRQLEQAVHDAFPDMRYTIDDIFAAADRVVVRCTFRGTHRGELQGMAPTGNAVSVTAIFITRFVKGKVAEQWFVEDSLGLMQQLGAVPVAAAVRA